MVLSVFCVVVLFSFIVRFVVVIIVFLFCNRLSICLLHFVLRLLANGFVVLIVLVLVYVFVWVACVSLDPFNASFEVLLAYPFGDTEQMRRNENVKQREG